MLKIITSLVLVLLGVSLAASYTVDRPQAQRVLRPAALALSIMVLAAILVFVWVG